ncbi:pyridoxal phosphate-dependent aminotransferase [Haloarcula laminariae]|uniref:pyridoxal phosphate-dependent aminotransferase n=1 Tax=Haloarcula laminariae TaxID=2961577 RepID=UPI002406E7CF|nr:pyridoxal phosphate-dependent aminotransferase [Halomicroarcula sp. FL173]
MDDLPLAARAERMPQSGIREIFDKAQSYDELHDLSIGEPDFPTPEPIADAVAGALGDGIGSYTQTVGRGDLRRALSEKLDAHNGVDAEPESELIVTPGAMGALFAATQVLCDPGDEVLVPAPYWPNYAGHLAAAGAELVPVPTDISTGFTPRAADLEAAASEDTVGVLLNTPGNPTGAVVPSDQLEAIGDTLRERDWWAVLDETYEDLVYDGATHHSLASDPSLFERTVTVQSFSKSYAMTGWRIGYATGPANVVSAMRVLQEHTVSSVAEPAQVAAKAALENRSVVTDIHEAFAERRELILDRLNDIPGIDPGSPQGAFYVFADVSEITTDSRAFTETLLEAEQVGTVPGSVFGPGGEGYLRFSYAADAGTISAAMDGLERVAESHADYSG